MDDREVEIETPRPRRAGRQEAKRPLALVATGVLSLLVFAAGGWLLRGLREGRPSARAVVVDRASAAPGKTQARGRLVFQVHCARCHGGQGHGDGPDAATLRPPPRDLTTPSWRTAPTRESIRRTVVEGIPNTMMTGLAAALSPGELDAVVDFVLSLAPGQAQGSVLTHDVAKALSKAGFTPSTAGRAAPRLTVRGVGGGSVTLDSLRGKLVVIVFWGTTCAPCVKELPELEALAERYRDEDLAVLPICADETDPAVVRQVAADRAPRLPVYLDPTGTTKLSYDVQALPTSVLVAPNGDVLGHVLGATPWTAPEVDALIRTILHRGRNVADPQ